MAPLARDLEAPVQAVIDQDAVDAHRATFQSAAVLPSPSFQSRLGPLPSTDDHWEVVPPREEQPLNMSPRPHQQHFPPPVIPSRSSSLGSLPPGASPPNPNPVPSIPRSSSPFSVASHPTSIQHPTRSQRSDRDSSRKKPPAPPSVTALHILKSLEPSHQDSQSLHHPDFSDDYHVQNETVRLVDKDKKKSFWGGVLGDRDSKTKDKDRLKDRDRPRDRDRPDDDVTAELTKMIGYLTATASEDWNIVLEVCERASANEANAKEASRALRREFKFAGPKSQLAAARLWAIMLRNASDIFLAQISQRKFIETLEDVLTSQRTSPVVRERLMEVLAAAAYITSRSQPGARDRDKDKDKEGFRALWCRLKPADKPEAGIPFDTEDAMFSPPVPSLPRPLSQYSLETPTFAQQAFSRELSPTPPPSIEQPQQPDRHQRIIPLEEDMRRLFQECKIARGNALLLSEALAFAKPEALDAGLIPEFLAKCRGSRDLIYGQIPWASAGAERSRAERALERGRGLSTHGSHQDLVASEEEPPQELTIEERLLADLLDANERLLGALGMYEDLERVALEKAAEERSRREVRMSRRPPEEQLGEPLSGFTGSTRGGSPPLSSPPTSPRQPFEMPIVVPSPIHPLPRVPPNLMPGTPSLVQVTSQYYHSQANTPTLLAPPHPLGPRSPAQIQGHSRTPSPDRMQRPSGTDSPDSRGDPLLESMERLHIENDLSEDEEVHTPIRPSAKALGKRRVIEDAEACDAWDQSRDRNAAASVRDLVVDSDSDESGYPVRRPPVRYVYDAAAERTAQHLKEGHISVLVNGVH